MTYESIQPFLQWIAEHPHWSGFAVFLISLSESLAIVGLVVPGVVMMTAIGAMMGGGILPFWGTLIWAILGAIAGDGISYWLGYHYHEHLRDFWPFKQFPKLLARGEVFFRHHGGKSIIFGRFVGPVRPMIPVIAGMMDMTPRRFLFFNIISAIAWAPLYSLPGILIGASLGALSPEVARRIVLLILLFLLALWIIYAFLLKIGLWIEKFISKILHRIWKKWQASKQLPGLHKLLITTQGTQEGQLGTALLFFFSLISFIFIVINVKQSFQHPWGIRLWNEPVYQVLRALYNNKIVDVMTFLTSLGDTHVLIPPVVAVGLWLFWRKRFTSMFCWTLTILGGMAIGYTIRNYIAMPRPDGLVYFVHTYSFPSGHALNATLTYGLVASFLHHSLKSAYRWISWTICILLILIISFSRLYLGVHWFTDVLGSLTLGIACVSLGTLFFRRLERTPPPPRAILLPGMIILFLSFGLFSFLNFQKQRQEIVRHWPMEEILTDNWWKSEETVSLHRSGAFKKIATLFDIQWLGSLDNIKKTLHKMGWQNLPPLTWQSSLSVLAAHPHPNSLPTLPKFHRDRLPALVLSKPLDENSRLVLQLWQSDFVNEKGLTLWLGSLDHENLSHPVPLVSLYLGSSENNHLKEFAEALKHQGLHIKILPSQQTNINDAAKKSPVEASNNVTEETSKVPNILLIR